MLTPTTLHRHQLVRLAPDGWHALLAECLPGDAHAALQQWSDQDWPLVVTRQRQASLDTTSLGLPAPAAWGRQRLALSVRTAQLREAPSFPELNGVTPLLAQASQAKAHALSHQLLTLGVRPRVHGSHGWQTLTGQVYLHPNSDLDLLLPVSSLAQADAVAHTLSQCPEGCLPRVDGELIWPSGAAVSWREWQRWRQGQTHAILVKNLNTVHLQSDHDGLLSPSEHCA